MCYVFVVCGAAEHVRTLNLSLRYLRQFTRKSIVVVTDSSRTPEAIAHDRLIDIRTPAGLDHHQASIFLKTSLHRILPRSGERYCYLDSDVIAVRSGVDDIFEHLHSPVSFGADHCKLAQFSPSTVRCGCRHKLQQKRDLLQSLLEELEVKSSGRIDVLNRNLDVLQEQWLAAESKIRSLSRAIGKWRSPRKWFTSLGEFVKKQTGFRLDAPCNQWLDENDQFLATSKPFVPLQYDVFLESHGYKADLDTGTWRAWDDTIVRRNVVREIERRTDLRYDRKTDTWRDGSGVPLRALSCDHLRQAIRKKFGTTVAEPEWQHWNGGVFLFDRHSDSFLDTWHAWTMESFADKGWYTRDQGTLVATVWKHGLENHPVLPAGFNLIADYHSRHLQFTEGAQFETGAAFSLDGFQTVIEPFFVHVYHHWEDRTWSVWKWLETLLQVSPDPERNACKSHPGACPGASQTGEQGVSCEV